jgi:drug/metabolite transporter (DMT)-like permease
MNTVNLIRLLALSAIWGGSFLFMRISAPILGPTLLIALRVSLAAVFLLIVAGFLRKPLHLRANWGHYLVLGVFNAAVPFLLLAYAAQTLSASLLSILNATAPIWSAVICALWRYTPLTIKSSIGLLMGVSGVALLGGIESLTLPPGAALAIPAGLGAACSYGVATTYARSAKSVEPFANAHGTMWAATLLIGPAAPFFPALETPGVRVMASVIALGVLCSGIAYLLYFRLIAEIGAAPALTVTFVIPVFGILWGKLFLGERVGWHTAFGAGVVLVGTALVTGFSIRSLLPGLGTKPSPALALSRALRRPDRPPSH